MNRKQKFKVLTLCLTLIAISHISVVLGQKVSKETLIKGTVVGIPDQEEVDLILNNGGDEVELLQSTKIAGGKFHFNPKLNRPASTLSIQFKNEKYQFLPIRDNSPFGMILMDDGYTAEITITVDSTMAQEKYIYPDVKLTSNAPSYIAYLGFRKKLDNTFSARTTELDSLFNNLGINWSKFNKDSLNPDQKKRLKTVQEGNVKLGLDINAYLKESIVENKDNLEGIFTLYEFGTSMNPGLFNRDLWAKWYDSLGTNVKTTHLAQAFEKKMKADNLTEMANNEVSTGKPFKDFTLPDLNKKNVTLSSLLGADKYVLLDFWASWCGPCRAENPNLLKAYNQYKDKGLIVVAVSLDKDKEDWLNAIKKDGMPWIHLSDLLGYKSEVVKSYGITGIPANFLLDAKGNIIAKDLHREELENTLKTIFNKQ